MHHRFGVIQHFPGLATAESEFTARLRAASARIAIECIVVSPDGYELPHGQCRLSNRDLDCVVSLHYSLPKTLDIYSLITLWNPWDYLWQFGYTEASRNMLTYDDYLSCGSSAADDHIARLRSTARLPQKAPLTLNPSISEPLLEPRPCPELLFYAGMNWERKDRKAGRHHKLLTLLDRENLVAIYGPDRQQGFAPWEGFNNYRGFLPCDGVSILEAINACGMALVLSSPAHYRDGIGTSRIFESVAAGALVISDRNPFVVRHFGDTVLYIPAGACPEQATTIIRHHVSWAKTHPVDAQRMALAAQRILRDRFLLSDQLREIYTELPSRASRRPLVPPDPALPVSVTVYFLVDRLDRDSLHLQCRNYSSQDFCDFRGVFVFLSRHNDAALEPIDFALPLLPDGAESLVLPFQENADLASYNTSGRLLLDILERDSISAQSSFVCFIEPHVELFAAHITELLEPFVDAGSPVLAHSTNGESGRHRNGDAAVPDLAIANASCTDFVIFTRNSSKKARCSADVTLQHADTLASGGLTRFMFRTTLFSDYRVQHTIPHLRYLAPAWLFLWSRAAPIRRVTHTIRETVDACVVPTKHDLEREATIIRDVSPDIAESQVLRSLITHERLTLIDWFRRGTADDYRKICAMLVDSLPLPSVIRTLFIQPLYFWLKRRLRRL